MLKEIVDKLDVRQVFISIGIRLKEDLPMDALQEDVEEAVVCLVLIRLEKVSFVHNFIVRTLVGNIPLVDQKNHNASCHAGV